MECQAIHLWTFTRLVGAYLDLAITFLLLCGSALAFAASRFLAYFGMSLPCPSNGMFGDPNMDQCLQKFLVEHPLQNILGVRMVVMSKFPYNLAFSKELDNVEGLMAKCGGYLEEFHDDFEGGNFSIPENDKSFGNEGASKGGWSKRKEWSRSKKRNRLSCLRLSSSASNGHIISTNQRTDPFAFSMAGDSEGVQKVSFAEGTSSKSFISDGVRKEIKSNINDFPTFQETAHTEETEIRFLEQALEEERSARAAIYAELEMERSAAASAADEAMAMILRLQEEKAIVEMGARQYKRMVEEKSVFDAEEMNLLKEILLRRERETHFLQMEVEAYRQMIAGNVQWQGVSLDNTYLDTQTDTSISQMELPGLKWNDTIDNDTNDAYVGGFEEGAGSFEEEAKVEMVSSHVKVEQTAKKDNIGENSNVYGNTRSDESEPHVYDVHVVDTHPNVSGSFQAYETAHGPEKISMRRNSMSLHDCERLRIESEVGLLREKIRIVQEGRDKLNLSLDQKEREKAQLQVLDDLAIQLQEIRNLTSPGSVARQSSLPPQSSKLGIRNQWMSRKKGHQSFTRGVPNKELFKEA